ncbi:MAG: MarR family transcriptional regulator [Gammaproteobacteria bacterium]|nr:MarR family transcriptional regulator [Gammaproteobacteria bacterium]
MTTRENGEMFTQLTLAIFKLSGMLNNEGDELTKEFGLTSSRWKILGAAEMSEIPLTVPQIARTMGQSRQAVQRLVDVMTKDGLLKLLDNPNHKRAKYVELTPEAKTIFYQLFEKQIPWAEHCSEGLSHKELETTLKVINMISNKLGKEKAHRY